MGPRTRRRLLAAASAAAAAGLAVAAGPAPDGFAQPRDARGRFRNLDGGEPGGFGAFWRWQWDRLLGRTTRAPARAPVPTAPPDWERIGTPPAPGEGARLTWVGHATFLLQLDGRSLLLDPVLGEELPGFISRNVPAAIPADRLPPIDAALVSHDHYDHLDLPTLRRVGAPVIGGLGLRRLLARERLPCTELGWWQSTRVGGVRVTFVPAQHFGQRGFSDRNERLWGGFVVEGSSAAVYHAGDTARFPGFAEIGARFAIDAALLPIGAYDPAWFMAPVHLDPEGALAAFEALRARTFVAMHWGTFKLSDEPLDEPPRRLEAERLRRGLPAERVRVLAVGETLEVRRLPATPEVVSGAPASAPPGTFSAAPETFSAAPAPAPAAPEASPPLPAAAPPAPVPAGASQAELP
ncbi:MAG TPA: MBL fold metallo-hydrolase [Anaeromyxobacteraceae bacterium]|jgi:L-ascorbate metabolism protein UlaG (beta-lactamase superfamily)